MKLGKTLEKQAISATINNLFQQFISKLLGTKAIEKFTKRMLMLKQYEWNHTACQRITYRLIISTLLHGLTKSGMEDS